MKEMIERIGSLQPARFAIANLTSGFSKCLQINLSANTRRSSPFGVFTNGVDYQWAFYPQRISYKRVWVYTYSTVIYVMCTLTTCSFFRSNDDTLLNYTRTVFQRCRKRNVTLNTKKLIIGFYTIPFFGHGIDVKDINMSQKQIESSITFCEPTSLKELQSFMGIVNYFKEHLRDHSAMA